MWKCLDQKENAAALTEKNGAWVPLIHWGGGYCCCFKLYWNCTVWVFDRRTLTSHFSLFRCRWSRMPHHQCSRHPCTALRGSGNYLCGLACTHLSLRACALHRYVGYYAFLNMSRNQISFLFFLNALLSILSTSIMYMDTSYYVVHIRLNLLEPAVGCHGSSTLRSA